MDISKHKQHLLSEIKINNPVLGKLSMEEFLDYKDRAQDEFYNYEENISEEEREDFDRYNNQIENSNTLKDIDDALLWLYSGDQKNVDAIKNGLQEDISGFEIGKTTQTNTGKTTVTAIDPETQSVTWKVDKDITNDDIHKDLSVLINKLELYKKKYPDTQKLLSLIQKIKFIRNTFKRSTR